MAFHMDKAAWDLAFASTAGEPVPPLPPTHSPEVQAVLDRMVALSPTEIDAIDIFVDGCMADGNWQIMDEFWCFALNATDYMTGWLTYTATPLGTISRVPNGMNVPAGAGNHMETGIVVSSLTHFQVTDATVGLYIHTVADWGGGNADFFGAEQFGGQRTRLRHRGNDTIDFRDSINSGASFDNIVDVPNIQGHLHSLHASATDGKHLIDGGSLGVSQATPSTVPTQEMWLGTANTDGLESQPPRAHIATSFYMGGGLIDAVSFYNRLITLQTSLGVI